MTKSFDDIVSNYKDPKPEWTVTINGKDYSNNLELLEFTDSVNNPLKFTVKLEGVSSSDNIPEDAEVVVSRAGGELFRGVLKEVEPNVLNTYTFKGTGYSAELEGDVEQQFSSTDIQSVIDAIVGSTTTNTNVARTFSTSYSGGVATTVVDDFRAKDKQLEEVNRLMGEYDVEWYTTYDGSNEPVFNVTDQISFTDGGNPLDTLTTYGVDQSAEMVKQNANRNKGDFDGVLVRGYGDGDDQVTATAGSTGKGNRVLIYTDKTIITDAQAQKRADNINSNKAVSWQEIEVKPSDPNKIYGVGDELKIESDEARLNDTYRVVESYFKFWPGEDEVESKLNLSSKPQTFVEDFKQQQEQTDSQTDYMQGSRNVWGDKEASNATEQEPLEIDFEVPQDVVDVANNNRLDRIEFNYACASYRQSGNPQTVTASNFDPGVKKVDTSVNTGGVEMERENISQHNHPVGSATSRGAQAAQRFSQLDFQNQTISGWTNLKDKNDGSQVLSVLNPEKDLDHRVEVRITDITDTNGDPISGGKDLHFSVQAETQLSFSPDFSFAPSSPVVGESVEFVDNTDSDQPPFAWHWRIEEVDGSRSFPGNAVNAGWGTSIEHVFEESGDYDVTLTVNGLDGSDIVESDASNNQFLVSGDITANLQNGDAIRVVKSDGNDGTYQIESFNYNGTNTEITTVEDVKFGYTSGEKRGILQWKILPANSAIAESVTKTVSVASNSSSVGSSNTNIEIEDVSTQASTTIDTRDPDENDRNYVGGGPTITFDGTIDSDESGTLYLDIIVAGEINCGQSYCFWQFGSVDSQDYFSAPSSDSYSLSYTFDDDLSLNGGPGIYSYRLRYEADDGTTQEVFRGPVDGNDQDDGAPVIYESDPQITSPNDGATINSSDVTFDIEGPYGNNTQDNQDLFIDGTAVDQRDIEGGAFQMEEGESRTITVDGEENTIEVESVSDTDTLLKIDGTDTVYDQGDTINFTSSNEEDLEVTKTSDIDDPDNRINGIVVFTSYLTYSHTETGLADGDHTATIKWDAASANVSDQVTEDSINFTIDTNDPPTADFSFSPSNPSVDDTVYFTDESTDDGTITKWEWDFGDGTTKTINSAPGDTSHKYSSAGDYSVQLTVTDDDGASKSVTKTVSVGGAVSNLNNPNTRAYDSVNNVGGAPTGSQSLGTQATSNLNNPNTRAYESVNNVGAQESPGVGTVYADISLDINRRGLSDAYEVAVVAADGTDLELTGQVDLVKNNHVHDIPRQDDFDGKDASAGAGAENKEVPLTKSTANKGDVKLDFSTNDESIVLDTTLNGNDVTITTAIEDSNGNITNSETITANDGTATTSTTYQEDDDVSTGNGALLITIDSASDEENFEVRDTSGDDSYELAAITENSFQSDKTRQKREGVSDGDNPTEQDVVEDVPSELLTDKGPADNVRIFIDTDPNDPNTNTEEEITDDFYSSDTDGDGNIDSGTSEDRGLDLSNYVDSPGWYRLKIEPNKPSYVKSRVFLDHHKDTE